MKNLIFLVLVLAGHNALATSSHSDNTNLTDAPGVKTEPQQGDMSLLTSLRGAFPLTAREAIMPLAPVEILVQPVPPVQVDNRNQIVYKHKDDGQGKVQ